MSNIKRCPACNKEVYDRTEVCACGMILEEEENKTDIQYLTIRELVKELERRKTESIRVDKKEGFSIRVTNKNEVRDSGVATILIIRQDI